jgi:hypothetical protein
VAAISAAPWIAFAVVLTLSTAIGSLSGGFAQPICCKVLKYPRPLSRLNQRPSNWLGMVFQKKGLSIGEAITLSAGAPLPMT